MTANNKNIAKRSLRTILTALLAVLLCASLAFAKERAEEPGVTITASGFSNNKVFTDDLRKTWAKAGKDNSVTVSCENGLSSVYIEFDQIPEQTWTITSSETGKTAECESKGFLHVFTDITELLGEHPKEVVLRFAEGTQISNVYAFSGEEPSWVQKWEPMLKTADIMLISTHADDEQLFFAGVLPYYAVERKVDVQVVYFVQHFHKAHKVFDHVRPHEQLDGLWTVGIRNYPYMSEFPDVYGEGTSRSNAISNLLSSFIYYGYARDDFQKFVVDTIRKFKPHVIVTHDFDGEYGHAAHMLNADVTAKAMELVGDPAQYPESAAEYGTWVPDKLYVHLYKENAIEMDWDTPYESLGGLTPFQVTQKGFDCHETQTIYWFWDWLCGTRSNPITKATQIRKYSPCKYGLYFTNVGPDVKGGDFLENVYTYAQQRIDEAEAEKKRQEEEAERKRQEEEAERKRQEEEKKRQEEEQRAREEAAKRRRLIISAACIVVAIALIITLITRSRRK